MGSRRACKPRPAVRTAAAYSRAWARGTPPCSCCRRGCCANWAPRSLHSSWLSLGGVRLTRRQSLRQRLQRVHPRRRHGSLRGVSGVSGSASAGVPVVLVRARSLLMMSRWMEGRLTRPCRLALRWGMQRAAAGSERALPWRLRRRRRILIRLRFLCVVLRFVGVGLHRWQLRMPPVRKSARGQGGDRWEGPVARRFGYRPWSLWIMSVFLL